MAGIFKKSKRLEDVLEKQMELNCKNRRTKFVGISEIS